MNHKTQYARLMAKHSVCPRCRLPEPILLYPVDHRGPAFYICPACTYIGQVGAGEVRAFSNDVR